MTRDVIQLREAKEDGCREKAIIGKRRQEDHNLNLQQKYRILSKHMESRKSRKTPICSRFRPKNPDMFPIKSLEKSGPGREHIGTRPGTYWELFKKIWQILVLLATVINATVVQTSPQ